MKSTSDLSQHSTCSRTSFSYLRSVISLIGLTGAVAFDVDVFKMDFASFWPVTSYFGFAQKYRLSVMSAHKTHLIIIMDQAV